MGQCRTLDAVVTIGMGRRQTSVSMKAFSSKLSGKGYSSKNATVQ